MGNNKGGTILILVILALLFFFFFKGCGIDTEGCYDSDDGLEYKIKGYTTFNDSSQIWDSCTGDSVIEQYCDNDAQESQTYDCTNFGINWTCSDGKCVKIGNGNGNGAGPQFDVNVDKKLQALTYLFTIVDGQPGVDEVAFIVTLTNTGDVDFTDIIITEADFDYAEHLPTSGTCTPDGFRSILQSAGIWGSQGPLGTGQKIPKESDRLIAEDCLAGFDSNTITFAIYATGVYDSNELYEEGTVTLTFEQEGVVPEQCDPTGWQVFHSEEIPPEFKEDTSGTCAASFQPEQFNIPLDKNYCYAFKYEGIDIGDYIGLMADIEERSWNEVEALGYIRMDSAGNDWQEAENFDAFLCGTQGGRIEDPIVPIMIGHPGGTCLKQCITDGGLFHVVEFTDLDTAGMISCAPTPELCNTIDFSHSEYMVDCGIECYGKTVSLEARLALMKEGRCDYPDRGENRVDCSETEWADFVLTKGWRYVIWRTPVIGG